MEAEVSWKMRKTEAACGSPLLYCANLELGWPTSCSVEDAQDFDSSRSNAIGDDVWRIGNHEFACPENPASATHAVLGVLRQMRDGALDSASSTRSAAAGLSRAMKSTSASRFSKAVRSHSNPHGETFPGTFPSLPRRKRNLRDPPPRCAFFVSSICHSFSASIVPHCFRNQKGTAALRGIGKLVQLAWSALGLASRSELWIQP